VPAYARFLILLKKAMPGEIRIPITALLDWFRPGKAVRNLVAQVSGCSRKDQRQPLWPSLDLEAMVAVRKPEVEVVNVWAATGEF
jgi:hypothetical protein